MVYSEKKDKKEEKEKGKVVRTEFRYSSFHRSFALPKDIDATAINATHKNGILIIDLPKRIEQKDSSVH